MLRDVAEALNFKFVVNSPKTGKLFAGVASDVLKREADFGVCHLYLTQSRAKALDHTPPIYNDYACFFVGS